MPENEDTEVTETGNESDGEGAPQEKAEVDYEALLKTEKERADKAEKALAKQAFKEREEKREETFDEPEEEDKPLTRKDLVVMEQRLLRETQTSRVREIARTLATSDAEANLIVEIHRNRIFPADLSLEEQIEEAYAIANRKPQVQARRSEIERATRSRELASDDSTGTYRDALQGTSPKLEPKMSLVVKQGGYTYDSKTKLYTKKLASGSTLYLDPKTNQQWTK